MKAKRNMPIARQMLDRLLKERIDWTRRRHDGIYDYRGRVHFDRLLEGIVAAPKRRNQKQVSVGMITEGMASPTEFGLGYHTDFQGFGFQTECSDSTPVDSRLTGSVHQRSGSYRFFSLSRSRLRSSKSSSVRL